MYEQMSIFDLVDDISDQRIELLKGVRTNETVRNYRGNDRTAEHRGQ